VEEVMVKIHQRQVMIELTDDEIDDLEAILALELENPQGSVEQVLTTSVIEIILEEFRKEEYGTRT